MHNNTYLIINVYQNLLQKCDDGVIFWRPLYYEMLVQWFPPLSYSVLTGGQLPHQNTPINALSHWLRVLTGMPKSVEPANNAQYSARVYGLKNFPKWGQSATSK